MIDRLNFNSDGLLPAVVQHAVTRQALMVGFMNKEAVALTLADRLVTFWSRSRRRLWRKGEGSGNCLRLVSMRPDCDGDTVLVAALPDGPVCHTGAWTCFGEEPLGAQGTLERLEEKILRRLHDAPNVSYTAGLAASGIPRIAQKVGEEAVETVIAAVKGDRRGVKEEAADLLYHLLVLLVVDGLRLQDVLDTLERRGAGENLPMSGS